MSTPVVFNGTTYQVPSLGETGWGTQVSNLLIALATYTETNNIQKVSNRIATAASVTVSATTDCLVGINFAGAVAVSLPAGVQGQLFYIKDISGNAATNNITITPNGTDTIEGAATYVINTGHAGVGVVYNGINWDIASESVGSKLIRSRIAAGNAYRLVTNDASGNLVDAAAITASRLLVSDANGIPIASATTATEAGYVSGVTSPIQTQLNAKQSTSLTTNHILVGAAGVATDVAMTGDVAITSAGVTSIADATVTGKLITGFVSGAGAVASTDTILQAIDKLDGNSAGKATKALDNLASVAVNTALLPGTTNTIALGSSSKIWSQAHLAAETLYGSTSGNIIVQAPATPTSYTLTLPPDSGTNSYVLQTNGSGTTSWVAQGASGLSATVVAGNATTTLTNVGTAGTVLQYIVTGDIPQTFNANDGSLVTIMFAGSVTFVIKNANPATNTDWIVADAQGKYTAGVAISITSPGTAPTKGTIVADAVCYARAGSRLLMRARYSQSSSGTAGTGGVYVATLPFSLTIIDMLSANSTSQILFNENYGQFRCTTDYTQGFGNGDTNVRQIGHISGYDSTRIKFGLNSSITTGDYGWGSDGGGFSFSGAAMGVMWECEIPITEFKLG